ncbi:MAG: hypothetical protein RLZZ324_703 [Candidatus Parcubacteria bacterium]|jgi:hypothetical protein
MITVIAVFLAVFLPVAYVISDFLLQRIWLHMVDAAGFTNTVKDAVREGDFERATASCKEQAQSILADSALRLIAKRDDLEGKDAVERECGIAVDSEQRRLHCIAPLNTLRHVVAFGLPITVAFVDGFSHSLVIVSLVLSCGFMMTIAAWTNHVSTACRVHLALTVKYLHSIRLAIDWTPARRREPAR